MNKLAMGCALGALALPAQAYMYIFTPGQAPKAVFKNGNSYQIMDMGGASPTQIIDLGGMTAITGGGRPTSFIMDGGDLGRSEGGVVPALNPDTGEVEPQINLQPEGIDVDFNGWE